MARIANPRQRWLALERHDIFGTDCKSAPATISQTGEKTGLRFNGTDCKSAPAMVGISEA
jgi:uncharacterized protein YcgI (DUF1989 family)